MKILHMITSLNRGGIEVWLMNMLKNIPRNECQMDFCCKGTSMGEMSSEAEALGANLYKVPLKPSHYDYIKGVSEIIREGKYDIVHNHLETYSWIPVYIAKKQKVPVITSFHNTKFAPQTWTRMPILKQARAVYSRVSINYALNYSEIITGCSNAVLKAHKVPEKRKGGKNYVLYYGIDFDRYPTIDERTNVRKETNLPENMRLLVHVGRFTEQKNHKGIIDIFSLVKEKIKDSMLILVGDGPLRMKIAGYVEKKGLEHDVIFLGIRYDVEKILAACDVFVFPSKFEGFGIAAVEANAVGLPVVGSRVPGLEEVVREGETGFLFELKELDKMANTVITLLQNQRLKEEIGRNGIAWARQKFSIDKCMVDLMKIYNECVR